MAQSPFVAADEASPFVPDETPVIPPQPAFAIPDSPFLPDLSLTGSLDQPPEIDRSRRLLGNIKKAGEVVLETGKFVGSLGTYKGKDGQIARGMADISKGFGGTLLDVVKAPGTVIEAFAPGLPTSIVPSAGLFRAAKEIGDEAQKKLYAVPSLDSDFLQGLGSAGAFLGGGAALAAVKVPAMLATGGLGVAAGGTSQYDEAIAMGATPEQAQLALAGGALFGATEAFEGAFFLKRLNQLTNGNLLKTLQETYASSVPGVVRDLIAGGLGEAVQEGIQTVGGNWVASDLAGYDPDRTLGENLGSNMTTGGVIGSFLGGALGVVRRKQKAEAIHALEQEFNNRMESGDPINFISGAMTPVETLLKLRTTGAAIEAELAIKGEQALQQLEGETGERAFRALEESPLATDLIPVEKQGAAFFNGPEYGADGDHISRYAGKLIVDPEVEAALHDKDKTPQTTLEALAKTDVVYANVAPYKDLVEMTDIAIRRANKMLQDVKMTEVGKEKTLKRIEGLQAEKLEMMAKNKMARDVAKQVKNYLAAMRNVLAPDLKVIVTDGSGMPRAPRSGTWGSISPITRNVPINGKPVNVATMYIRLDDIVTKMYTEKKLKVKDATQKAKRMVFETISHEMGHAIANQHLTGIIGKAMNGDRAAAAAYARLVVEYDAWLRKAAGESNDFYPRTVAAPQRGAQILDMQSAQNDRYKPAATSWPANLPSKDYLFSFDEFFAEMTARLAAQGELADPIMTGYFKPAMKQYQEMFKNLPEEMRKSEWGGDWKQYLESLTYQHKIREEVESAQAAGGKDLHDALAGKIPGMNPDNFAGFKGVFDKFNWMVKHGFTLLQLKEANPHVLPLKDYVDATVQMQAFIRNFTVDTVDVLKAMDSLGRAEFSTLSNVLFEEATSKKLTDLATLSKTLSAEGAAVYTQIRKELNRVLDQMRAVAIADTTESFRDNTEKLNEELKEVNDEFDKMKKVGYFPFLRFGRYNITVTAKEDFDWNGEKYKKGQMVSFPVFESKRERDAAFHQLRAELGAKAAVSPSVMKDAEFMIQGMPRSLLRGLKRKLEATGTMPVEMQQALDQALSETLPFNSFKKNWIKKKGIHGYSEDMRRAFATYMRSAAGHIARVKYADMLREPVSRMQQEVKTMQKIGELADRRQEMHDWMQRHMDYVLNPKDELTALRGAFSVAYLGFNVKSGVLQMMQLPQVVYPYLAARYGDVQAVKHITQAIHTATDYKLNGKKYELPSVPERSPEEIASELEKSGKRYAKIDDVVQDFKDGHRIYSLNEETGEQEFISSPEELVAIDPIFVKSLPPSKLPPPTKKQSIGLMLARGLNEGWIDQSYATELAVASSENNLDRSLFMPAPQRMWYKFSHYAMLPFQITEKANRVITSIAAYNAEIEKSGDHEKAILEAKQANWSGNFEYARWNRPSFMRGKKSIALMFATYMQHSLYFATKDPGAVRYWMMMLTLAGLMGLPGSEDVLDLANAAGTYLKQTLGMKNPKVEIELELRKMIDEFGANPDLILHGISQDSFGMAMLGELAGIPIPSFDLSGSLGQGDIVPGTNLLNAQYRNPNDGIAAGLEEAAGPAGNLVLGFYDALHSRDPMNWKRMEKLIPLMALRNVSKAARLASEGQEVNRAGESIAEFDPHDTRDKLSLVGQALGFTPTKITEGWQASILAKNQAMYYTTRRSALLAQHNWALFSEDREGAADVRKDIVRFNEIVPFPELGLTSDAIMSSAREYVTSRIKAGAGIAGDRKNLRLIKSVEGLYRDPRDTSGTVVAEQP